MDINFKFPEFAIGFHSGWIDRNNDPTKHLTLTRRKIVRLVKISYKPLIEMEGHKIPCLVKSRSGILEGLSSGAGSTIYQYRGGYYKFKRNGFRAGDFIKSGIQDRAFKIKNDIFEKRDNEDAGIYSKTDAYREIKIEKILQGTELEVPQKTIALYNITNPFGRTDSVILIQIIDTDFRVDEYCIILLINLFHEVFGEHFEINLRDSHFAYGYYSLRKAIEILEEKYAMLFILIGQYIGRNYRVIHDSGIIRGISNSWYGNDLICNNGTIGICDLESCFTKDEIGNERVFQELKKTDIHLAKTAFYESMNYFDNSLASFVGVRLISGFNEGYRNKSFSKLDPQNIKMHISSFIDIRNNMFIKND